MDKKIIKIIPFAIAYILVIAHIIQWSISVSTTGDNIIVSPGMLNTVLPTAIILTIILVLIILKKVEWKFVFLALILLSYTPVVQFYHWNFSFGIGFFQINLISTALLVLHLKANEVIMETIYAKLKPGKKQTQKRETKWQNEKELRIQGFERRFQKKEIDELEKVLNNPVFSDESKEAAKRLLEKKTSQYKVIK